MPILPWRRHLYPSRSVWAELRERIRLRAGGRCEWCRKVDRWRYTVTWDGSGRWLDDYTPDGATPDGSPASEFEGIWRDRTGQVCAAPGPGVQLHETLCILTVAHLDQDPSHNDEDNLAALCQSCHLNHDRAQHIRNRPAFRMIRQERRGQLPLPAIPDEVPRE